MLNLITSSITLEKNKIDKNEIDPSCDKNYRDSLEKYTGPHKRKHLQSGLCTWYKVIRNASERSWSVLEAEISSSSSSSFSTTRRVGIIRGFRANERLRWVRHYRISNSTRANPRAISRLVDPLVYKYLTCGSFHFVLDYGYAIFRW